MITPRIARIVTGPAGRRTSCPSARCLASTARDNRPYREAPRSLSSRLGEALPPGELSMEYGRGPEYRLVKQAVKIPDAPEHEIAVQLERWVEPAKFGWYSGDHHIHAAGCSHYTSPTQGVLPADMFRYVKGEGLNVGCCLTWGPCFDFQRRFFYARPGQPFEPRAGLEDDGRGGGVGSRGAGGG